MDSVTYRSPRKSFCWHAARCLSADSGSITVFVLVTLEPFDMGEVGQFPRRRWHVARAEPDDEEEISRWYEYAQRLASAWNGVLLAAALTGKDPNCPPLILADAVEDQYGSVLLARDLRGDFGTDLDLSLPAGIPFPFPDLPGMTSDECRHLDWLKCN